MAAGGVLKHVAIAVRNAGGQITGVVVASDYLSGDLAERARRMSKAYEDYTQLRVLQAAAGRRLRVVLRHGDAADSRRLDVDGAVSRQAHHAAGADAVGSGAGRLAPGTTTTASSTRAADEFGSMVEAFNAMAAEVAQSRRRLERASIDLERKHEEGEGRRRYIEAILERIATGVVSIDRGGRIGTINPSAHAAAGVDRRRDRARRRGRVRAARPRAGERRARSGGARQDGFVRAGSRAGARRARAARGRGGDARRRHRRQLRRHRAGRRRRDAADSRAEGGGLARSGAAAGARDQESADADPAVGRAAAPQAQRRRRRRCRIWCRSAPRRSSARSSR